MNIKELLFIVAAWFVFGFYGAFVAFVLVVVIQMVFAWWAEREEKRTRTYNWIQ